MTKEEFEQEKKGIFQLINSWEEKNIRLATLIWKNNKALEEAVFEEFKHLLEAKDYTSLLGLKLLANLNAMNSKPMDEKVKYIMNVRWLHIPHSNFDLFPDAYLRDLEQLKLSAWSMEKLPSNISKMRSLKVLDLSNCSNFKSFPKSILDIPTLNEIKVDGTRFFDYNDYSLLDSQEEIQSYFKSLFV